MAAKPIIAIVGQTATGKSAVAIELAEALGGEIICADSRTIYKGMDIGTAKPTLKDQARVSHHGLDLATPNQTYSAHEFQQYAQQKIKEIHGRGNIPFIVGGTGLYVDGVLYNYNFGNEPDEKLRAKLSQKSLGELQEMAVLVGIDPQHSSFKNQRHLARMIERGKIVLQKKQLPTYAYLGAVQVPKDELHARIEQRFDDMVERGLVAEARQLLAEYGSEAPGLQAPIYKALAEYFDGSVSLDEARDKAIRNDEHLAKRQLTWFKRNPDINWVQSADSLKNEITLFLTKI